ncbi:MAG: Crp/Fnr family transcriptional regulator [Rhodospirillales bacterium]|nr:Crp/Fnr family transcriptional regulator [Rhodospirillales bacterium]
MRAQADPIELGSAADRLAAAVGAAGTTRRLVAGEALFRQRDPARAIFAVLSGRVLLVRHTPAGQRVLLHNARPGELLAEAALFAESYHCDAIAATAAELRVIPTPALRDALRRDPALALGLARTLAHQVQGLRARLALRDLRPAGERPGGAGAACWAGGWGGARAWPARGFRGRDRAEPRGAVSHPGRVGAGGADRAERGRHPADPTGPGSAVLIAPSALGGL